MGILDDLLADARREAAEAKRKPAHRATPAEDENPYIPTRLVAYFNRCTCAHCGTTEVQFEGLFEERRHRRVSDTHMVRQPLLPTTDNPMPRVRLYRHVDVPYCSACAGLDRYEEC